MECGLGEERHWGKLWLIPALIFGIGIFSTFFVTSSNLTASQVVAGAFGIENINLGSFKVEGVIVMGVLLCILTYVVTSGGTKKIASLFSKLVISSVKTKLQRSALIKLRLMATFVPGQLAQLMNIRFPREQLLRLMPATLTPVKNGRKSKTLLTTATRFTLAFATLSNLT